MATTLTSPPPGFVLDKKPLPPSGFLLDKPEPEDSEIQTSSTILDLSKFGSKLTETEEDDIDTGLSEREPTEFEIYKDSLAQDGFGKDWEQLNIEEINVLQKQNVSAFGEKLRTDADYKSGYSDFLVYMLSQSIKQHPEASFLGRAAKQFTNSLVLDDLDTISREGLGTTSNRFIAYRKVTKGAPYESGFMQAITDYKKQRTAEIKAAGTNSWWKLWKNSPSLQASLEAREVDLAVFGKTGGRTISFDIPPPETWMERIAGSIGGVGAFITRLAVARKLIPFDMRGTPLGEAIVWEAINTQGRPGGGALMSLVFGAIGSAKTLGTVTKVGLQSGALASMTALGGGELEDILVSALIPVAMAGVGKIKGKAISKWESSKVRVKGLEKLGLNPNATHKQIKTAYRKFAKERHPDAGGDEAMFKELQAYYTAANSPKSLLDYFARKLAPTVKVPVKPSVKVSIKKSPKKMTRKELSQAIFDPGHEGKFLFHISPVGQEITVHGLQGGGLSGTMLGAEFGNFVHVFLREDIPAKFSEADLDDIVFLKDFPFLKPIETFTVDELGIEVDPFSARAQEMGIVPELPDFMQRPKVEKATQKQKARSHIIKRELEITDEVYRQVAKDTTGTDSVANMTKVEASAFIDALSGKLPEPPRKPPAAPLPPKADGPKAILLAADIVKKIIEFPLRAGLEPAKITEKSIGADAVADIYRGTRGKIDVAREDFQQTFLASVDMTVDKLDGYLRDKFSSKDLLDFMVANRGRPTGFGAKILAKEATERLPDELSKKSDIGKAVQELSDKNFAVAKEVGERLDNLQITGPFKEQQLAFGDWAQRGIGYYEDYFYGQYKNGVITVKDYFSNIWPTTEAWRKTKTIPSPADAIAAGLELRNPDPLGNLRAERMAIARMGAAINELEWAYENGRDVYVGPDTPEFREIHPDWKVLDESVFKGHLFHPDYVMLHNNLVSFNRITANPALSKFRSVANFMRYWRLWLPVFHEMNIEKAQLKEVTILGFDAKTLGPGGLAALARKLGTSPVRDISNPVFRDWLEHGFAHRTSMEFEAITQMSKWFDKWTKNIIGNRAIRSGLKNVNMVRAFREWLFNEHIPNIKYASILSKQAIAERKLGRPLTSAEKMNIIKETQNFYGEMNEAIFGRSGTATSALRLFYTAPGYAEGNFRTIFDAIFHWQGRGRVSRRYIPLSFAFAAIVASLGTRLFTGKWKKAPTTANELRDFFKIETPFKDDKGRTIFIDAFTDERDYFLIFGHLVGSGLELSQGRDPVEELAKIPKGFVRRGAGMTSGLLEVMSDLSKIAVGEALYDYQGNKIIKVRDPILKKALKLAIHELSRIKPIALGVFQQARRQKASIVIAAIESILAVRPTLSEDERDKIFRLKQMFELLDDTEKLYRFIGSMDNPREAVEEYLVNVERIVDIFPEEEQSAIRIRFRMDQLRNLEKAIISTALSKRTPTAKKEAMQKIIDTLSTKQKD